MSPPCRQGFSSVLFTDTPQVPTTKPGTQRTLNKYLLSKLNQWVETSGCKILLDNNIPFSGLSTLSHLIFKTATWKKYIYFPQFSVVMPEAQKISAICSRSHDWRMVEPRFEPRSSCSTSPLFLYIPEWVLIGVAFLVGNLLYKCSYPLFQRTNYRYAPRYICTIVCNSQQENKKSRKEPRWYIAGS